MNKPVVSFRRMEDGTREDYLLLDRSEVFEPYVRKIFSRAAHDPRYASPGPGVVPPGA
jgi:hypothetical protein